MTRKLIALTAFASATVANAGTIDPHHPNWLVGRWATIHPGQPSECGTQFTVTYHASGRYDFMDESGRWRLDGDRLTETMTRNGGTGDDRYLNRPRTAKVIRQSRGGIRLIWSGRGEERMTRCPTG